MRNADIIVVTTKLEEQLNVLKLNKVTLYCGPMTAQVEALALSFEQIKKFIEEQNAVIYYEEAVNPKKMNNHDVPA